MNVIHAKEALLTDQHLALVMEYAACGSLTSYVAEKWQTAQTTGLFCEEEEALYFFRVREALLCCYVLKHLQVQCLRTPARLCRL